MLRQNPSYKTIRAQRQADLQTLSDMESLRAAYRAVAQSSAETTSARPFSAEKTFQRFTDNQPSHAPKARTATTGTDGREFSFPLFDQAGLAQAAQPAPSTAPDPGNARPPEFRRHKPDEALRQHNTFAFDDIDADADAPFEDLPPHPESLLVKIVNNPKPVAIIIGTCLLASGLFAAMGYGWLLSHHMPVQPIAVQGAQEPIGMMAVQESDAAPARLDNIRTIQDQPAIIVPQEPSPNTPSAQDTQGTLLAQANPAANPMAAPATVDAAKAKSSTPELTGRPDPFAPLVQMNTTLSATPTDAPPPKKDVLTELQYTGFIGNINAKNKLAVIKVAGGGTLIKKVGDAFSVDGERVVLKGIAKRALQLSVSGETRSLALAPYQETVASSAGSSSSAAGSYAPGSNPAASTGVPAAAPGMSAPSGGTSAPPSGNMGNLGNLNALGGNGASPAPNPQLQEPPPLR